MKCVSCGKAELVSDTRDVSYTYKGETTTIQDVSGDYCPVCNESLHNAKESKYLNAAMLAFAKQVNGASVKPEFISETRKRLQLDQREDKATTGISPIIQTSG
ncbi:MAG: type II TA system antitoxin MqsA family protein [Candidatus Obscuribacterales bacterium]|jgi:HTH-type transcriptional regulator/antitoxin MqsA